jgi:hypothetical protein
MLVYRLSSLRKSVDYRTSQEKRQDRFFKQAITIYIYMCDVHIL